MHQLTNIILFASSCLRTQCANVTHAHKGEIGKYAHGSSWNKIKLECGPMPKWWPPCRIQVYRWRPLFNAAKFDWRPLLECRAVTLPRRESSWNLLGCPKQPKRSEPLVGRSSPYCEDIWRRYCCLITFFRLSIHASVAKIQSDKVVWWCADGDFLRHFCVLYFQQAACSTFQTCILNPH